MREVLRRIAIHGGLAALVLGIIGFMLAELASIWLAGSPGVRTTTGAPVEGTDTEGSVAAALRARMPLVLSVWGFVFVAVGELALHVWRGRRKPVALPAKPDEAEKLLEELLCQVESQKPLTPEALVEDETSAQTDQPPLDPHSETKV